tara:strand:+ start:2740 stop:3816 length:1077 start_codon:yes stop_codon:yes gene_type:complete
MVSKDSALEKLTIVIFSYNRQRCLQRSIDYWLNYNVKILILDGSETKLDVSHLNNKNITYIYDPRSLHDRLLSSINYIDTEFVMLSADDEFYLPSAISSCINFLLNNSNFSSCGGRAVKFYTKKNQVNGYKCYPGLENLALDDDNAIKRVKKHFSKYVPAHFYSVTRSNIFKIICKNVFEKNYKVYSFFELQFEFLVMVSGKSKIIPELMWLRNKEEIQIEVKYPKQAYPIRLEEWWYKKEKENDKKDFLKRTKNICDNLSSNEDFEEKIISEIFETYINSRKKITPKKNNIFKSFLKLIPQKIKNFIKLIIFWDQIKNLKLKSLLHEAHLLENQNVIVNYIELDKVISIINSWKNYK